MITEDGPTKAQLQEQAQALGIQLSNRAQKQDWEAAIDAYSRGCVAGCEKSYKSGYEDGQTHAAEPEWEPKTWQEAESTIGRQDARQRFPVLFDEHKRRERILRKAREM